MPAAMAFFVAYACTSHTCLLSTHEDAAPRNKSGHGTVLTLKIFSNLVCDLTLKCSSPPAAGVDKDLQPKVRNVSPTRLAQSGRSGNCAFVRRGL